MSHRADCKTLRHLSYVWANPSTSSGNHHVPPSHCVRLHPVLRPSDIQDQFAISTALERSRNRHPLGNEIKWSLPRTACESIHQTSSSFLLHLSHPKVEHDAGRHLDRILGKHHQILAGACVTWPTTTIHCKYTFSNSNKLSVINWCSWNSISWDACMWLLVAHTVWHFIPTIFFYV